jgi:hypothetical protein
LGRTTLRTERTAPDGTVTRFEHDSTGAVCAITGTAGKKISRYRNNAAGSADLLHRPDGHTEPAAAGRAAADGTPAIAAAEGTSFSP